MRTLILVLAALIAAIALGTLLSKDTGLLIFSYAGYNIQMSLSFFILALVLLFILIYLFVNTLFSLIRLPRNIDRWSSRRRHRRSEKYLTQGLLAMLEGNWKKAEETFQNGAKYSRLPLVNYLAAARAAQQSGEIRRRDHYLRLAHEDNDESSLALGLTQARVQLSEMQTEQAYATLKHLRTNSSKDEQVDSLLLEAATELKEWREALTLLNSKTIRNLLTPEQLQSRQISVYCGLLTQAGNNNQSDALELIWKDVPRNLKSEPQVIEAFVKARLTFDESGDCENLLRKTLNKKWDRDLVYLYSEVTGAKPSAQLKTAERWLQKYPQDAALLLCLGRLCKRNSLWGKAKVFLQESIEVEASPQAYQDLARLLEQQGEHAAAAEHYQKGLALATGAIEEEPLVMLESPEADSDVLADGARQIV